MNLIISPGALKTLRKMPLRDAQAMREKLIAFAADPFASYGWAKRLVSSPAFRVRHGDWRAICQVDGKVVTVTVEKVGNRKDVYK